LVLLRLRNYSECHRFEYFFFCFASRAQAGGGGGSGGADNVKPARVAGKLIMTPVTEGLFVSSSSVDWRLRGDSTKRPSREVGGMRLNVIVLLNTISINKDVNLNKIKILTDDHERLRLKMAQNCRFA
jgi:hypothetical protein